MIRKKKTKKKDFKRSVYIETVDSVFSHYIRQKYSDDYGEVSCYTCGKKMPWNSGALMQNGHYGGKHSSTRGSHSTRWHEDACRPQCYGCNVGQYGMQAVFHENLVNEIGKERVDSLVILKNTTIKLSNIDLLQMIGEYYQKLRWPEQISQTLGKKLIQLGVIPK